MRYGYRVDGAWDPKHGVRFNPYKLLLDPYAKGIDGHMDLTPAAFSYACDVVDNVVKGSAFDGMSTIDSLGSVPISVAIDDRDTFKHVGDPTHPHVPWSKTVIYELHVKGFTANAPWLPKELRGTYAGLAHPQTLSYLAAAGRHLDRAAAHSSQAGRAACARERADQLLGLLHAGLLLARALLRDRGLAQPRGQGRAPGGHRHGARPARSRVWKSSWMWSTTTPAKAVRKARPCAGAAWTSSRTTAAGRTIPACLRTPPAAATRMDFTNTHIITYAIDSLRYWAKRIGIDGFRFDLAASLARLDGEFTHHHPFLYALRSDLLLGNLKLIMEPWDLGNAGWQTGQFGSPFAEWNDRFRDATRKFWLSDAEKAATAGTVGMQDMATRLCGSADLFATEPGRGATSSINYVVSHDGFTLSDLTMYSRKHNQANRENNTDGSDINNSANFGVEGPSDDAAICANRERAALNMLGTLLLSLGTPMLEAGDEFGNSQQGNNNPYCQDNDISWLQWDWLAQGESGAQTRRMQSVAQLISIRKSLDLYHYEDFFTRLTQLGLFKQSSRVQWFLPDGTTPMERDWFDSEIRAFTMRLTANDEVNVLIVINGDADAQQFRLPTDSDWRCLWTSAGDDAAAAFAGHTQGWAIPGRSISLMQQIV
jgi:glycogen operon protein